MSPKKIFIVFFIIIIFIPTLMIPFYESSTASENRAQVKFPEFTPQYPLLWKRNFEKYYDSNFAFRTHLYSIYKYYKWNILGSNPFPQDVIVGKEGWLFPGNKNQQNYDQSLGIIADLESRLDSTCLQMKHMEMFCDSLGVDLYIAVGPDKGSVYSQYLPVKSLLPGVTLKRFTSLLRTNYNINVIDLGAYFSEAEKDKKLYYKTDSHWNYYGAYLGTQKLLDVIREKYNVGYLKIEDYSEKKVLHKKMDLSSVLDVNMYEEDIELLGLKKQYSVNEYFTYYAPYNIPITEIYKNDSSNSNLKCIVFRDSFFKNMMEFFCSNVDHTVLAIQKFDKELIIKEKPDFVVYELVERRILSFDMNGFYL